MIDPVGIGREYIRNDLGAVIHQQVKDVVGFVFIRTDPPGVNAPVLRKVKLLIMG